MGHVLIDFFFCTRRSKSQKKKLRDRHAYPEPKDTHDIVSEELLEII